MAEIKNFQEGWNKKHKDFLEAEKKRDEIFSNGIAECDRLELRRRNSKNKPTADDCIDILYKIAPAIQYRNEALALNPYKASEKI